MTPLCDRAPAEVARREGLTLRTVLGLASLSVVFYHKSERLSALGRDYLLSPTLSDEEADVVLAVSPSLVEAQMAELDETLSYGYAEWLCAYRLLSYRLPRFGAFVFHGAVVAVGEAAYAFSGKSGVGKSTHTALWERYFGARYLNGDKPILRVEQGRVYAYGTPWAGKCAHQQENRRLPLFGLCFLSQSPTNAIEAVTPPEAARLLMPQTIPQKDPEAAWLQMELLDTLATSVPLWRLACNVSREAAELSYNTLTRNEDMT